MYVYLNVRSDDRYSKHVPPDLVRSFLVERPELVQLTPVGFTNAPGSPWLSLSILHCTPEGNFACDGRDIDSCNLVELIGSALDAIDPHVLLMRSLAAYLEWEFVDVTR